MARKKVETKKPEIQKDELTTVLEAAKAADKYMVGVWSVREGELHLFRLTNKFPLADIPEALAMLKRDLEGGNKDKE
jgi:hypothetical protein